MTGSTSDAVRVFVVAGVRIHREALVRLLNGKGELEVTGEAPNAQTALAALGSIEPDLLEVRSGFLGRRAFLIPVERVEEIRPEQKRVVLRAQASTDADSPL